MLSRVLSSAVHGIDGYSVVVEVDFRFGFPSFTIVGLPDAGVRESRERVIAAIKNSDQEFPLQKITINLAPAHIKKEGSCFDLPIAVGILSSAHVIPAESLESTAFLGELGLNGEVRPVQGVLPCVLGLKKSGIKRVVLPSKNAVEAALVKEVAVFPVDTLADVINLLTSQKDIPVFTIDHKNIFQTSRVYTVDYSDVKGQRLAKRALEIAAAGSHNILLLGPPGSGKTLLAHRLPTILPDMEFDEALETTKIHSVAGILRNNSSLLATRPFRSPHHQVSDVALIGGGSNPRPGEVSLAHRGVLFLDEFPEFGRNVLESLRQPMEDRQVTVVRVANAVTYPSDFLLVAAANPCPCGYLGSEIRPCTCPFAAVTKYRAKLSGPLMDRIDLHIEVPALKFDEIAEPSQVSENSMAIRCRVGAARQLQRDRFKKEGISQNGQMNTRQVRIYCPIDSGSKQVLRQAISKLGLSARAYDRILKVARTIADLSREEKITQLHIMEAIGYRSLDRMIDAPVC